MSGIGHNGGPTLEPGAAWRRHCWRAAREDLLPTLPVEVVRLRVKRAKEIGLDYRTYAGIRATTGRDLVAFLFSTNALSLLRGTDVLPREKADKLSRLSRIDTLIAVQPPLSSKAVGDAMAAVGVPCVTLAAPLSTDSFQHVRLKLDAIRGTRPGDAVLLVGSHALERDWVAAGRLAGFLSAEAFFDAPVR